MAETNPAYTVEGVEVDVTDQNAVKAREKALDEAQVKAFQILAERFLGTEAAAAMPPPDPVAVSALVQDFEMTREQASKVRYKGVYTVRFRPGAVRNFMGSRGKSYSDEVKKPVMILPFYQLGERTLLWEETNPWMMAWRNLPAGDKFAQPTILPLGDAQDMQQVGGENALNYDPMDVQQLADRYGADDIAIAVASPEPSQGTQGKLAVNLYSNSFNGAQFVQKITVDQFPEETDEALFARAAVKIKDVLKQDWKANMAYNPASPQPAPAVTTTVETSVYGQPPPVPGAPPIPYTRPALGPSSSYQTVARFASVQDWVRMKNTLDRLYGMQSVMIKGLKSREAFLDMRYAGNLQALQLSLQNAGISMRPLPDGRIEIFNGPAPGIYNR